MKLFDHRKRENVIIPLFMLFVIITTMILGTVMTWKLTIRRMKDSLHQQISSQADALADKLDSEFALLNGLGTAFTLDDLENLDYILEKLTYCADKSDFMTVNFAYADGKAYRNDGMEMDVSGYEYFKQCLNGEEAVQCISGEGRQTAVRFEIAVPIIFHDHIAGVLIGDYNEEKFRSIFQTVSNGVSEFSYVCDSDGRIVIATRQADQALKLQGLKDENGGNIFTIFREAKFSSGSRQYVEAQMENQSGGEITYTYQGEKSYAMFEPLGINDWYIITVLPESQIYAEAMETVQISYVMLAAVMFAVVCLIAYLLLRERNERLRAKEEAEELNYILAHDELTGVWFIWMYTNSSWSMKCSVMKRETNSCVSWGRNCRGFLIQRMESAVESAGINSFFFYLIDRILLKNFIRGKRKILEFFQSRCIFIMEFMS